MEHPHGVRDPSDRRSIWKQLDDTIAKLDADPTVSPETRARLVQLARVASERAQRLDRRWVRYRRESFLRLALVVLAIGGPASWSNPRSWRTLKTGGG